MSVTGTPEVQASKSTLAMRQRAWPVVATLVIGAACSVAAFLIVRHSERLRVENEFGWRSRNHAQDLRVNLQRLDECLFALRDIYRSSHRITYAEFTITAADLRERHRGIEALQWLPQVTAANRATFEKTAKKEIAPDYEIRESTDAKSTPVRAAEFPEYAPVYYVEPKEGNDAALGVDWYHGPYVKALERARDTGSMTATARMNLGHPAEREVGWAYFLPLYVNGPEPASVEERRARFRGFVQGTFCLRDLLERGLEDAPADLLETLFLDDSGTAKDSFLILYQSGEWKIAPPPDRADFERDLHNDFHLDVGGRDWHVFFRPAPAWIAAQETVYPQAALGGGLLITALLGSLVRSSQRRANLVTRLVHERTAELHATQESLRDDIARRETTERALRESEDRYRAFVEQSTEAIWRFEHDPGISTHLPVDEQIDLMYRDARLAECNDVMAQMYGFARSEELIGAPIEQIAPRSDPQNAAYFRAFIESGYRIADWETREIDKNGQPKFFLNNETGIVENGLLMRAWGTQRDITERKHQSQLQLEQDARLRLAVTAANLGTWDWDLRTDRIIWSAETEKIYGLEPGTFDGLPETFFDLIHPEDRPSVRETIRRASECPDESVNSYEMRAVHPNGNMRWLVARGTVLREKDGTAIRRLGTVMDITAARLAEAEKARMEHKLQETQKLESLGILAGGIAHDFNNLLTGILGNASLARLDLPANSPAQISLEQIELVSQRAADLCKQMLAYSGKGRFMVQRLDLSTLVRDTADLLRLSISKNAVLKFSLTPDLPAINADATQMRQILMNLIINASEAISERSGVITISTGLMHADRGYLTDAHLSPNIPEGEYAFLEVSDNGMGMDAETRARIFDPFFTTKFTGRGLGLAAVLGIVRGHSGALKVYSEPGRGTTFKLLLPRAEGSAESLLGAPEVASSWRGSGTMLVVDDEETVRTVSARMLAGMGFDVVLAANGSEALQLFEPQRDKIVGVLLDLTMPKLDGTATFTELRRLQPGIRVLLMSGFNEQDAVNRFASKGLAGFLQKPFKPETLHAKLRAIFESAPTPAKLSLDSPGAPP